MNKTELIAAVAEKAGLTKKDVEKAVAALLETVKGEVAKKGKVQLIGFGTFEARTSNARTGKNPRTNEPIKIPAATVPAPSPRSRADPGSRQRLYRRSPELDGLLPPVLSRPNTPG